MGLNERVEQLESLVKELTAKVIDLSSNVEEKGKVPFSVAGGIKGKGSITPVDAKTGLGQLIGNHVVWNDTEVQAQLNVEPASPNVGYNKHSHSRYSGGALIKDMLEIVEFEWGSIVNKHSQQFWTEQPAIKTEANSNGEYVEKIGNLDLFFNPDTGTWGVAAYEIDIKKCYFVERDENGDISLDENGNQKRATLYNTDTTKTSIVWDKNGKCWRLYCAFAPGVGI